MNDLFYSVDLVATTSNNWRQFRALNLEEVVQRWRRLQMYACLRQIRRIR